MMTFRWSWIFILYSLLVRLGSATVSADNHTLHEIYPRAGRYDPYPSFGFLTPDPPKKPNIGAIVGGVVGGLALVLGVLGWYIVSRRRKLSHVEEGANSPWRPDDPKSQFSPDEKGGGKFDRLRDAFNRRGNKKQQPSLLPIFQIALPHSESEPIGRPAPSVPSHVPRYPSMLERGGTKKRHTPPPLEGYPDLSRTNSVADSLRSISSSEGGEKMGRRKIQVPPKALVVTTPGRPLPGFAIPGLKSPGVRPPKSPSRRRSWFSKNPLKHPFVPIRNPDNSLRFPPGSPLHPGHYQPSRYHLEARKGHSPRPGPMSANHGPGKDSVRRPIPPIPTHLQEDPGSSKQARLVEALNSADLEGPRVLVSDGSQTALPVNIKRRPPHSARFLPDPPTTSHI